METKNQRSLKQNRYRWSVVVKYYRDWLNLSIEQHNLYNGTNHPELTSENADFFIKDKVWGLIERVEMPYGELLIELPLRNAEVGTFEERMEQARAYAALELHFEIPLPREDIRDLEDQYKDNLARQRCLN